MDKNQLMTEASHPSHVRNEDTAPHQPPFFVVGSARSGTTLLQALIDAHPNIAIPPESHIYDRVAPVFDTYGDLGSDVNRLRFIADLLADPYIKQWRLDVTPAEMDASVTRRDRVGIIRRLFSLYARQHDATRWGDKTPD